MKLERNDDDKNIKAISTGPCTLSAQAPIIMALVHLSVKGSLESMPVPGPLDLACINRIQP